MTLARRLAVCEVQPSHLWRDHKINPGSQELTLLQIEMNSDTLKSCIMINLLVLGLRLSFVSQARGLFHRPLCREPLERFRETFSQQKQLLC